MEPIIYTELVLRPGGQWGWLRHPEKSDGFINNLINLAKNEVCILISEGKLEAFTTVSHNQKSNTSAVGDTVNIQFTRSDFEPASEEFSKEYESARITEAEFVVVEKEDVIQDDISIEEPRFVEIENAEEEAENPKNDDDEKINSKTNFSSHDVPTEHITKMLTDAVKKSQHEIAQEKNVVMPAEKTKCIINESNLSTKTCSSSDDDDDIPALEEAPKNEITIKDIQEAIEEAQRWTSETTAQVQSLENENQEVINKQSSLENEEEKSEDIKEDIHQEFKKEDSTNEDENENQDKDENEDENENKAVIENSRVISTMTDLKPQLGLIPNETDDESKDEDEDDDENNLINRYQNYPTTKENSTQNLSQSLVQYDKKYPVKMMTSMENPGNLSDLTETQIKYVKPPRSNNNISKNSSSTTKNKYHSTNTHMAPNVKKFMEWEDEKLEEFWEDRGWKGKETKIKFNFDSDGNITIDPVTPAVTDHDSKELDVINEELVHSPNTT